MNNKKTTTKKVNPKINNTAKEKQATIDNIKEFVLKEYGTHYVVTGPDYLNVVKDLCAEIKKQVKTHGSFTNIPTTTKFELLHTLHVLTEDMDEEMDALNDRVEDITKAYNQFPTLLKKVGVPVITDVFGGFEIDVKQLGDEFDFDISDIAIDDNEDYEDNGFEEGLMDLLEARVKAREEKAAARATAKVAKATQATDDKPKKTTQKKATAKTKTTTKTKAKTK